MPIINFTNETTQLEFGTGDIRVSGGLLDTDEEVLGAVCFFQTVPQAIGIKIPNERTVVPQEETPVRMVFSKVESIDVVIRALEKTKEYMLHGIPDTEWEE